MELRLSACILLVLCVTWSANGGNILVWYTEGSHWINMKPVLETLVDRGHQVTVLPFNVSFSKDAMQDFLEEFLRFSMYEIDYMSYWEIYIRFSEIIKTQMQFSIQYLDGVVKSEVVMKKLKEGNYDLLLADPIYRGSDLVADILGIPLVFSLRFSVAYNWERHCGQMPAPPSFVPGAMSKLTDKMDFSERVWNFLFYALQDIAMSHIFGKVDRYYSDVKGTPTSACELMSKADIWLIRTYWDFEFPRPFLPSFKFVGGIHCRPAKPLPEDLEEFVQSSGDDGIVIFTLGSMIKNVTKEKANMIASGLAQIPQKVLWRYRGEKPATLGANTRIYDWIPQNDLLGHPKTRAFITHGGTNGIYEAIYHGVPMVGIPMFGDQPDNMVHMKAKGAAVILNLNFITTEDLRDAINTVINDKSYKENAMRLSSIHHDRPMSALEEAVFWIEFTLRNKGAKHLRVQAHELTWYQYLSLDVLGFFLTVDLLLIFIFIKTCSFCLHRIRPQLVFLLTFMELRLSACITLVLCVTWSANGGNILVWYTEGSHWINMKPVLETLVDRGHQVTVLVPSSSMYMNTDEPARFHYEPFNVSFSLEAMEEFLEEFLQFNVYEIDYMNYLELYIRFIDIMKTDLQFSIQYLDGVVKSEDVMKKLKEGNYDLLLADPIYPGSDLVADILGIPLVFSLRFSLVNNWERHCGQMPAPPSFVPGAMSKLTDKMDFSKRVLNFLFYALQDIVIDQFSWKVLDRYYSDVKGTPTSACELMSKADIWLIRTYWDFEFPRPFLPNFKYVGGIHCRPAKPLPEDLEEFVQSSGDDGIVIFTLGSMINNVTKEKANMIASGLAQIPQKVLWRYRGEKPETLGANTRIYDWIPQNDLLGHPKTRAFITHGGTNGIYEAIYHGVPMVGIPMFGDQPDNMVHMKAKGAAVILNVNFMTTEDLRDAINTVINDKSYKENAMRLSSIHHDRPMSALEEAVFWIEFTLRNKGAKHLRVQAHELTWYQYLSLDVLGFFLTVDLLLIFIFIKTCSFCLHRCCVRKGKTKRKAE
ncbi:trans-L-3-hydroxyproline dehydratase [Sarotherodon galilaeus]